MKIQKRFLSILLVLSMVTGLFAGQSITTTEASAAQKNEIVLGELQMQEGYYTYPDATILLKDETRKLYHLSVSVDSGYMMVGSAMITGVSGKGIVATSGDDVSVEAESLTTTGKYESISFDITDGATKDEMESFISNIRFTTEEEQEQVVSVSATGVKDAKMTAGGKTYDLEYFNGHFYAIYTDASLSWKDAYNFAHNAEFAGVNGYLLTITSLAEDRFIWGTFGTGGTAKIGWMGCTRATTKDGTYGGDGTADDYWNPLPDFDTEDLTNNVWRWVCGPEAGEIFGYQSDALMWQGGTSKEGDFVTASGYFSNWNKNSDGPKEPNGGNVPGGTGSTTNKDEGYGYYGDNSKGNWNDHPDDSHHWHATYIEFGAPDEVFKEDGEEIIVVTEIKGSNGTTQNPAATTTPQATKAPAVTVTPAPSQAPAKTQITGKPAIKNISSKDSEGNDVVKAGTVLEADVQGVNPADSHDTLTYQWYYKDGDTLVKVGEETQSPRLVLTEDILDKELVVEVHGNGAYYGELSSDPYDAKRTNADITAENPDATQQPGVEDGKRYITVKPTKADTIYAIKDEDGNVLYPETVPAYDADGNLLTPNADQTQYPGYYAPDADGVIRFLVDKSKTYDISEITIRSTTDTIVSPSIPSTDIKTDYDDKGTPADSNDDEVTIIIEKPLPDTIYAVLKKDESGSYVEVPVKKEADGTFTSDSTGSQLWSDGTVGSDGTIRFTGLEPGTYKVVAKSDSSNQVEVQPGDITSGGSNDITPEKPPVSDQNGSAAPSPVPGQVQGTGGSDSNNAQTGGTPAPVYTADEESAANVFIKEYVTDANGKLIISVTDMTRDLIVSGENSWNKLTEREQAIVNGKLLAAGSPYTYEELLKKAKEYKIPGFKVIKYMQKKTTAKLKLIKCKGATIVCTSTNKKVATVNKKGVIKAKKKGRATLTFTAIKGKYTNRLVIDVRVKKKFRNAKELKNFKSKVIKTPTVLIAKQRILKKSSKIVVYDLEKTSKVKYTPIKKGILKMTKKGKYTGKKNGKTLVRVNIKQNDKTYLLYVYVTIYQKKK